MPRPSYPGLIEEPPPTAGRNLTHASSIDKDMRVTDAGHLCPDLQGVAT